MGPQNQVETTGSNFFEVTAEPHTALRIIRLATAIAAGVIAVSGLVALGLGDAHGNAQTAYLPLWNLGLTLILCAVICGGVTLCAQIARIVMHHLDRTRRRDRDEFRKTLTCILARLNDVEVAQRTVAAAIEAFATTGQDEVRVRRNGTHRGARN